MSDWWQWSPKKENQKLGFAVVGIGRFGSAGEDSDDIDDEPKPKPKPKPKNGLQKEETKNLVLLWLELVVLEAQCAENY